MCGLGNGDTGAYFDDIEYAFSLYFDGNLGIYEAGVLRGYFGTYAASDRLRVAVEGGIVKYYRNGVLLYTSTVAPQYPLLVDTSLNTVWSYIANVVISTVPAPNPVNYVLQDTQGSTRAVMSGSAIVARHDYLPFGEEIGAGTGQRTGGQGYGVVDKIRQRYGLTERDDSSGLDHTWWRKYESYSGRWTSPDPYGGMSVGNPQSLNRYSYVQNDPVNLVDPTGLLAMMVCERWLDNEGGGWMELCAWGFGFGDPPIPREPNPRAGRTPPKAAPEPQRFGRKDKEERCRKAVDEAQRASDAIERRFANAIRAGGLDATHQKSIEQSINQLNNAIEAINKNCFDGPNGPPVLPELEKQINDLRQKASEYKVPPVGWDGGRTAAQNRIKGAALLGNLGGVISDVVLWVIRLRWAF